MTNMNGNKIERVSTIRCCYVALAVLVLAGCSQDISSKYEATTPVDTATSVDIKDSNDNSLINQAKEKVKEYKLSKLPLDCMKFESLDETFEGKPVINVREKHGGRCGGDPATEPRLFYLVIEPNTGEVWSDAKSTTGELEKLIAD